MADGKPGDQNQLAGVKHPDKQEREFHAA